MIKTMFQLLFGKGAGNHQEQVAALKSEMKDTQHETVKSLKKLNAQIERRTVTFAIFHATGGIKKAHL